MTREEMEKKRDALAESGEYSEGESCSFYMDEIQAFKNGWDACAEEYEKEIERLNDQIAKLNLMLERKETVHDTKVTFNNLDYLKGLKHD